MMSNWQEIMDSEILLTYAIEYGEAVCFALLIFAFGLWLSGRLTNLVKKALSHSRLDATLVGFLGNIIKALLITLVAIAALGQLGVETTSLAAMIAAAGLAVGLALQGSLANFAAGVMVIGFKPFKAGDYVEAGGVAGTVVDVGIFYTTLKTPDNCKVIVPNSQINGGAITNYSAYDTRRFSFVFSIGYDDDIAKAKRILQEIITADDRLLKDPAPTIGVLTHGESSIDLACRPWVKTADYWTVYWDMMEQVKQRFDAEGISIPFPQREVHVVHDNSEAEVKTAA